MLLMGQDRGNEFIANSLVSDCAKPGEYLPWSAGPIGEVEWKTGREAGGGVEDGGGGGGWREMPHPNPSSTLRIL